MPAYIKELHPHLCNKCRKPNAKYEVYNTYKAYMGTFCKTCAEREVRILNEESQNDIHDS